MHYNIEPATGLAQIGNSETALVCPDCQFRFQQSLPPPPRKPKTKHLWVDAIKLVQKTRAVELAHSALDWANGLALPAHTTKSKGGPKPVYSDARVLLT